MHCHMRVIYYVPAQISDERIAIGVVVYNSEKVLTRFPEDYSRVQAFARPGTDLTFLRDFAERAKVWREEDVQRAVKWMNCIQLGRQRTSLRPPEDVMDWMVWRCLVEPTLPISSTPTSY